MGQGASSPLGKSALAQVVVSMAAAIVSLDSWEIGPFQPYFPVSFQSAVRQTWGTRTTEEKLQKLLRQFQFAPVRKAHRGLFEDSRQQPIRNLFQHVETVEQVAG